MPLFNKTFSSNVIAFTSDRTVDFKIKDTQIVLDHTQKEFLSSQIESDFPEPIHITQVHGNRVIVADKNYPKSGSLLEEADGLITKSFNLPLAVRTADCLPVFLYDEKNDGIGMLHVGWKSLQKDILPEAINLMKKEWNTDPSAVKVVFGPSIRACCFEISKEFGDNFSGQIILRDHQYYFDLPQYARDQLYSLGVIEKNITDCGICTCCDQNYYSVRREDKLAGRMISLIMLKGTS